MGAKTGITWQEFITAGKEGQRWECVDGEVVFMSPVFSRQGRVNIKLGFEVESYCRAHPEWVAFGSDTAFTMTNGNWRCPDLALVRKVRAETIDPKAPIPFAPDIALEILSPSETGTNLQSKRQDYSESKVTQVWLDPEARTAEGIPPDRPAQYFRANQVLTFPELPGFRLGLQALFT